ncbi:MAG: hypothetical protein QOE90_2623 [Thermoplasmata archaeon]|nr:hypothetical protein [Thermoplasmata archaeon]
MEAMSQRSILTILVLGVSLCVVADAVADNDRGDASTGRDAGNTVGSALLLPGFGAYTGSLYSGDVDWYAVSASVATPQCVSAAYAGAYASAITLNALSSAGTSGATMRSVDGGSASGGLAVPDLQGVQLGAQSTAAGAWNRYGFSVGATGIPDAGAGDAGTGADGGNDLAHATPAQGLACIGGHVGSLGNGLPDLADYYSLGSDAAGSALTLSLASTASPVQLTLFAPDGSILGTIQPGQLVTFNLPSTGTYTVSASRAPGAAGDVGYLIGVLGGPGCAPTC